MEKRILDNDFRSERVQLFPEIDLSYSVSKEVVWENLLLKLSDHHQNHRSILFSGYKIAVAASISVLLCLTAFLKYYTKEVYVSAGNHLVINLPDNSLVELNAESHITYHPYWFIYNRAITLEGEAFFEVTKGNTFKVISGKGETVVHGTSFNIYSRNDDYRVTCFTGQVSVSSSESKEMAILNPDDQVFINQDGVLHFIRSVNSKLFRSWRENMFFFTGSPVNAVLQEIERQYNIKVKYSADTKLTYTGNFSKTLSEKDVLDLVCTSLGLNFEVKSGNEFLIK